MANFEYANIGDQGFWQDEYTVFTVLNHLFGVPMYAWYVVELELFEDGDIKGTLLTPPFTFHGPFESEHDALVELRSLMDSLPMDSQQS